MPIYSLMQLVFAHVCMSTCYPKGLLPALGGWLGRAGLLCTQAPDGVAIQHVSQAAQCHLVIGSRCCLSWIGGFCWGQFRTTIWCTQGCTASVSLLLLCLGVGDIFHLRHQWFFTLFFQGGVLLSVPTRWHDNAAVLLMLMLWSSPPPKNDISTKSGNRSHINMLWTPECDHMFHWLMHPALFVLNFGMSGLGRTTDHASTSSCVSVCVRSAHTCIQG